MVRGGRVYNAVCAYFSRILGKNSNARVSFRVYVQGLMAEVASGHFGEGGR